IILCLVLAMSFVVAVPASARTYAVIEFEGLDLPVPGDSPDYAITSLCEDYDVMNFAGQDMIIWVDEDEALEMAYNDTFVDGHDYRVKIYLEPTSNQVEIAEGAKFMMDQSGLGWFLYEDSNGIYAQKYFDTCGKIKNACVYIDEPVAGAKPDFTLTHDNRFVAEGNVSPSKNGVSWYDVTDDKYLISGTNDVFKAGHEYKVTFNLRSYDSVFVESVITVNRYNGIVEILSESFANVEYTFPKLAHTCVPVFVKPKAPTCDEEGHIGYYLCECGKIYWDGEGTDEAIDTDLSIAPTGHSEITVAGKAATCTETGLTEGKKCEICDKVTVAQEEIPVIAHKEVTVAGKDATCTEAGLTEGKKCEACGKVIVAQEEIPVIAHKEVAVAGKDATCTETGLTEGKKCEVCGKVTVAQEEIPVGHKEIVVAKKVATYFASGYTGDTVCVKCSKITVKGKAIAKLKLKAPKFSVIKGKKQFKVKYIKVKDATKFQVRYRIKGKWKIKTFKAKKNVTKIIKKLKKGTYKVQVRAMVVKGKQKAYSAWSKQQKVKVK
ncbi:MAG: hypothetical protein IJD90_02470, partial [Clostridia bacterium]|nr:hypothetical protein [Clostridia bacterium]